MTETRSLPPVKVALLIDGRVIDVLHTDERLGSLFLSDPQIIDVTDWYDSHKNLNLVNATFDGKEFTPQEEEQCQRMI